MLAFSFPVSAALFLFSVSATSCLLYIPICSRLFFVCFYGSFFLFIIHNSDRNYKKRLCVFSYT